MLEIRVGDLRTLSCEVVASGLLSQIWAPKAEF
jgi:hypothetical protein